MALVPGYVPLTFTEQITWQKLLKMFTSGRATISAQNEIIPGVITVSTSAPSGKTGDAWFDVSLGSGYGRLRIFDGSDWKDIAEGFIGQNNSGLQLNVGEPVKYDSSITTALPGSRTSVVRTTAQSDHMLGVAGQQINNGEVGIILTRGKVKVMKDAASITAGQPIVPSATAAQATTNSVGSWGNPFGSSACGQWLETSAAAAGTLVSAILYGNTLSSWVAWKSTPAVILNNAVPSAHQTWQTAVAWSTSPAGTVAHIIQAKIVSTAAVTADQHLLGFRANGSSLTIDTGAVFMAGFTDDNSANARQGLRAQLIIPMGADNTFQWYTDMTNGTAANTNVLVHEIGAIVGGQVV